jgi:serine/threonine protein kinase
MTNFNDLKIVEKVAEGGQATIYKCVSSSGEHFALKVFNQQPGFEREIAILSAIGSHENILSFVIHSQNQNWPQDLEVDGKTIDYGILFPFAEFGSLEEFVKKNHLDSNQICDLIKQLAAAVSHVHAQKFSHRDIKPANVLVTSVSPFRVVLADFGLAKRYSDETELTRKVDYQGVVEVALTDPWYVGPELYRDEDVRVYSEKQDYWSLGVTFWEAIHKKQFVKTKELKDYQISSMESKLCLKGKNKFVTERLMMLHDNQKVALPAKRAVRNLLDLQPEKRCLEKTLACVNVN